MGQAWPMGIARLGGGSCHVGLPMGLLFFQIYSNLFCRQCIDAHSRHSEVPRGDNEGSEGERKHEMLVGKKITKKKGACSSKLQEKKKKEERTCSSPLPLTLQ